MRRHLLGISAIALLSTMSIAVAQDRGGGNQPSGGGASPPSARGGQSPSEQGFGTGPTIDGQKSRGSESGASGMRGDEGAGSGTMQERSTGQRGKDGQSERGKDAGKIRGEQRESEGKSENRMREQRESGRKDEDRMRQTDTERKGEDRTRRGEGEGVKDEGVRGAGGGEAGGATAGMKGGGARLDSEKRTKVQEVFKSHKTSSIHVNVDARPGVKIPRHVTLAAVPQDVVVIVPGWRRYRYVVIDDKVCIIDPDTYEIVDVIVIS